MKRICVRFLTIILLIQTVFVINIYGDEAWYSSSVSKFKSVGVVTGDEDFEANPTRYEVVALINAIMGYTENGFTPNKIMGVRGFADLEVGSPEDIEFRIASYAGYIAGDDLNNANPNENITRQEFAVVLSKLLNFTPVSGATDYSDDSSIAPWAREYVIAASNKEYFYGDSQNMFMPNDNITLGQLLSILDRVTGTIIYVPGNYMGNYFTNNVTVVADNCVFDRAIIDGDMIISKGISEISMEYIVVNGSLIR